MYEFAVIALAVAAGFFVRAVTGFAAALIALPILMLAIGPQQAVGLLALYFFLFSLVMVWKHRRMLEWRLLAQMGAAVLAGMLAGIFLLSSLPAGMLLKVLGVFILCYLGYRYALKGKTHLFEKLSLATGFVGGIFSGLYAAGGSLYVTYLHNKFEDADLLRANAIGMLGIADLLRFPLFVQQGLITTSTVTTGLLVLPVFALAIFLGQKVHCRINKDIFDKVVGCLLAISAIGLLAS